MPQDDDVDGGSDDNKMLVCWTEKVLVSCRNRIFTHFENEDVGGEVMVIIIRKVKTVLSMYQKHKVSVGSLTGQVNINKIIEGD